jgi:hypothetical protein
MKKLVLLTLLLVFIQKAFSQKWALPSSEWVISYAWVSPVYNYTIKVEGDTTINGTNCKKIGSNVSSPF